MCHRCDITAGFQAAHGDILVLDGKQFYEVRGYKPGRVSPFDPRPSGYTLLAGVYSTVDKTVTKGRDRNKANKKTRVASVAEPRWISHIPLTGKAMVLADDIANSYWNIETSDEPNMCGYRDESPTGRDPSYGKTTAQLQKQSTFQDWDFINTWNIGENQTYPYLRTVAAGDINKDRTVNFLDLCIVGEQWMKEQ